MNPDVNFAQGSVTQPGDYMPTSYVRIPDLGGTYSFVRRIADTVGPTTNGDNTPAVGERVTLEVHCMDAPPVVSAGNNATVAWTPFGYPEVRV